MGFKVRIWSTTNARPYDVVFEDHEHNNVHYQPGVEFSTLPLAEKHLQALNDHFTAGSLDFIRSCWPKDGPVTA